MDAVELRRKTRLLTAEEVAAILGIKPRTLQNWRVARYGPAFVKAGKAALAEIEGLARNPAAIPAATRGHRLARIHDVVKHAIPADALAADTQRSIG